jgi:hypothetical protein
MKLHVPEPKCSAMFLGNVVTPRPDHMTVCFLQGERCIVTTVIFIARDVTP